MAINDGLRAIAALYQSDPATFPTVASADMLSHDTSFEHTSNIGHDTPEFQRYSRMVEVEDYQTTVADQLTIRGYVDTLKVGFPLVSALGSESISTSTHTFPSVTLADYLADNPLLAFSFTEGQNDGTNATMHRMGNARTTSFALFLEAPGGRWMFEWVSVGIPYTDTTLALASITFPDPVAATDRFVPGMVKTVISRAGTETRLISARITITNEAPPVYGTRITASDGTFAGADALAPYRFENGAIKVAYDFTYESRQDTNAGYTDYSSNTERAWIITSTYGTHSLTITINRAKNTSGSIDRTNPGPRQRISGKGLLHAGTKSVVKVVLVNDRTTKYNA